jgi:hypothetical protein
MIETSSKMPAKTQSGSTKRLRCYDLISAPRWQGETSHENAIGAMTAPTAYDATLRSGSPRPARYEL